MFNHKGFHGQRKAGRNFAVNKKTNDDLNNLEYHVPPDFNIPKGQEHCYLVIVPEEDKENNEPTDLKVKRRHKSARAFALGLKNKQTTESGMSKKERFCVY